MFSGNEDELATAIGVPLLYGIIEAVLLAVFCLVCWKIGWTKAPAKENLCVVLYNSYEVEEKEQDEVEDAIEVVLGFESKECAQNDLIFAQTEDGTYTVDKRTLDNLTADKSAHDSSSDDPQAEVNLASAEPLQASGLRRGRGTYVLTSLPSSTIDSSQSSGDEPSEDAATIILAMEDEERHLRQNRLGRTISTIRARATGYVPAPPSALDCLELDSSESSQDAPYSLCIIEDRESINDRHGKRNVAQSPNYQALPIVSPTSAPIATVPTVSVQQLD
jgi:hypothetical protein